MLLDWWVCYYCLDCALLGAGLGSVCGVGCLVIGISYCCDFCCLVVLLSSSPRFNSVVHSFGYRLFIFMFCCLLLVCCERLVLRVVGSLVVNLCGLYCWQCLLCLFSCVTRFVIW